MTPSPTSARTSVAPVTAERLASRLMSLELALAAGGAQLDPAKVEPAEQVAAKVHERTRLTGGHTVVALAGATGSGKSSLFNALVGAAIAEVGVRRPTTSAAAAAIFDGGTAESLLDWLKVGTRHVVAHEDQPEDTQPEDAPAADEGDADAQPQDAAETPADAAADADAADADAADTDPADAPAEDTPATPTDVHDLDGLILLDLPDFDSVETAHRTETERVIALADVIVWVTDPQKYADARLHDDFVATLSDYDAVMLVVLNQVDRLTGDQTDECVEDLRRILVRDGIGEPKLLTTSALTGQGVPDLRAELVRAVQGSTASRVRLAADLTTSARSLMGDVAAQQADPASLATADLVDALSRAAGVPTVLDAVERDFRQESMARTGWPFTRWIQGLRPDPLKRLRVNSAGEGPDITEADVRQVLGRSSIPPPTPAARAAVDLATRALADRAAQGLPPRWAEAVDDAATPGDEHLADALDQAVLATPLRGRPPAWWSFLGALQVLCALAAIVGLIWLVLLGVAAWLQFDLPTPGIGPFSTPFLLLAGGLVLGLLLTTLAKAMAARGARRRAAAVEQALRTHITAVVNDELITPVAEVLARHSATRDHLRSAAD